MVTNNNKQCLGYSVTSIQDDIYNSKNTENRKRKRCIRCGKKCYGYMCLVCKTTDHGTRVSAVIQMRKRSGILINKDGVFDKL